MANNEIMGIIQGQIEQLLVAIRDQRQEIATIKDAMVTKNDLRDNRDAFNDKIDELHEYVEELEGNIEKSTERIDILEGDVEETSDFVKNIKNGVKWLIMSLFLAFLSALASVAPTMWANSHPSSNSSYSNQVQPIINNNSDNKPIIPHVKFKI